MWTGKFWKASIERCVKTFFQGLASAGLAGATDVLPVGWKQALAVAGFAAVASLVTSLASLKLGAEDSPSLVAES